MSPVRPKRSGALPFRYDSDLAVSSTRPLRVTHFGLETLQTRPGGLNRYLFELNRALRALGVESMVLVAAPVADTPDAGFVAVVSNLAPIWQRPRAFWKATWQAAVQPDVYDAHFAFYAWLPVLVGKARGIPLVVHFQGPWAAESAIAGDNFLAVRVKRVLERSVYHRAGAVVVLSPEFRDLLVADYRVPVSRVHVLAPGVDTERFCAGSRRSARKHLDLPDDVWLAIAVRRLVPRMGLDVLLEAWARLNAGVSGALLVVVGAGPELARLSSVAEALGISAQVRFAGRAEEADLPRWYQAADLSIIPSVQLEGFGLVALESLASGTPVVASDLGGLRAAIGPLGHDLLVRPGDPGALADRLQSALDEAVLPSRQDCRRFAEGFSWPGVARRHRDLYEGLLDKRNLRVAVVGHSGRLSGGELALNRVISALKGVDFHVVLAEDGPVVPRLREAGATVEILPLAEATRGLGRGMVTGRALPLSALIDTARYVIDLRRALRSFSPDVVHTNSLKAALYGAIAARSLRLPVVWHVRDSITPDYLPRRAVQLIRLAARFLPTEIVANSRYTLSTLHLPRGRGSPIASPIDVGPLADRSDDTEPFRVGILGRLAPWKGQDVFLRAFAKAFVGTPEVTAVIIGEALFGETSFVVELHQLVKDLGLVDRVEFRGFRDDLETELGRIQVLVHASTSPEPFGQVVVQGMAAGLPVVASNVGGPSEIITDGIDGLLCPPGDVMGLARRLGDLHADPELRRKLGDAGRERSLMYTADRIAPEFMKLYRRVIASSSHSAQSRRSFSD